MLNSTFSTLLGARPFIRRKKKKKKKKMTTEKFRVETLILRKLKLSVHSREHSQQLDRVLYARLDLVRGDRGRASRAARAPPAQRSGIVADATLLPRLRPKFRETLARPACAREGGSRQSDTAGFRRMRQYRSVRARQQPQRFGANVAGGMTARIAACLSARAGDAPQRPTSSAMDSLETCKAVRWYATMAPKFRTKGTN